LKEIGHEHNPDESEHMIFLHPNLENESEIFAKSSSQIKKTTKSRGRCVEFFKKLELTTIKPFLLYHFDPLE
jgi:hypothetical protein